MMVELIWCFILGSECTECWSYRSHYCRL